MTWTRRRIAGRLIKVVAAVAVAVSLASLPSSAAESPEFPGLPDFGTGTGNGGWIGPKATAINQVATARQWLRLPPLFTITWLDPVVPLTDPSCRRLRPYQTQIDRHAVLFFVSTNPAAPEPYGYAGPFTVRTVAFGSIPVEADVLVGQPRDEENLPVGYQLNARSSVYCNGMGPHASPTQAEQVYFPVSLPAPVDIVIQRLKVDGVTLRLREGCAPSERSVMELTSNVQYSLDPNPLPGGPALSDNIMNTSYFVPENGGLLFGTLDIAPFAGCITEDGEDVSALLTATVSGTGNAVEVRSEGLKQGGQQCAKDRSQCVDPLPGIDLPEGAER